MRAAKYHEAVSVKRGHQRVDCLQQLFPGGIHVFMEAGQFRFVGICKVLDTPLEFRKTPANIIQLPIVVHLDADLLPSEPSLQVSDP